MPVAYYQLHPMNSGNPGFAVAIDLASQVIGHFYQVRGVRVGIGPGSCCAAVAVQPGGGYPAAHELLGFDTSGGPQWPTPDYGAARPYAIVYGNSQLTRRGLDMDAVGGHAERVALNAAVNLTPGLYDIGGSNAVLFVELTPCGPCQNWLANIPAFQGFGAPTLNVWWRWEYPDWNSAQNLGGIESVGGLNAMIAFHGLACDDELSQVLSSWQ
jgi:hypothetical protein